MSNYVFAILADIHWGKTNFPDKYYIEMKKNVIDKINKLPILDAIIICGDYFDRVLSMHHDASIMAIKMIHDLINIAEDKKAKIRVIMGTKSHDNDMLKWFTLLANESNIDLLVIYSVKSEELFDNFKVLYLPEEYIESYEDYYKDYFIPNEYNMVFGHGLIDKAAFISKQQESEFTSIHAPVFKSDDLLKISKGPIFFGHIHIRTVIKKRIYYVGSISRYSFGEEIEKGFMICFYNTKNDKYNIEFIKNNDAPEYNTYRFEVNVDTNYQQLMDKIKLCDGDYIRLIFNNNGADQSLLIYLTNLNSKTIKVVIDNSNEKKQIMERDAKTKLILHEYDFLFDKNIDYSEKIYKYLIKKGVQDLTPERIKQLLYEKFMK